MVTEQRDLRQLELDLGSEFGKAVDAGTVERVVHESVELFSDARIRSFVPVLVKREARERLRTIARRSA